ncbi:MAG: sensor signal transduction histidine kinase [Ramlibacter sp.]|uniref:PAS domain-containing sensor histidine kinase n=1 Tax=Ramlibacter sp. TaxID=1917967 RepID=UPI00260E06A0|nr:ATP-binding protein [Ramlibacter sp.]MDB5752428.1 sensor signal transduction histidine kinase [Ramlibacter sp.]
MQSAGLPGAEGLYDSAPCGLLVAGDKGHLLHVNRTLCRWLKYEPADLLEQMRFQDLLTMGGRIFHQTHLAPLLRMQGSVAEVKLDLRRKDGVTVPVMLNAVERHWDGQQMLHASVFLAEDRHKYEGELLAQRRRAEDLAARHAEGQRALALAQERLRLALESADLYGWDLDPATGERRYEEGVGRLLGLAATERVDAARFMEAIAPDDRPIEAAALGIALLSDGDGTYRCRYRLRGADGAERVVASSGRAFFEGGRLIHFTGILQDVTDAVRRHAEAQDRALFAEQMVGIVSHDLRNPLSAIDMSAQLLTRTPLSQQQRLVVDRVLRSAGRARRLISELLDFTQARVGRGLAVRKEPLDLHALASEAVNELSIAFPDRTIRHVQSGPGSAAADADRMAQALGNLVGNAVAYGAPDRPVTVSTGSSLGVFRLSVHNEGAPIPADLIPRLFEPMVRGDDQNVGGRGVGLGLYIVREIARAHGGTVHVQSKEGEGTTFTVAVPVGETASAKSPG